MRAVGAATVLGLSATARRSDFKGKIFSVLRKRDGEVAPRRISSVDAAVAAPQNINSGLQLNRLAR
jgi:hypothetical protein